MKRLVLIPLLAVGCTAQPMARQVDVPATPGSSEGPAPVGAPVPSTMADTLSAAGLDLRALPALDALSKEQRQVVMKSFATALGEKCSDCHAMKMSDETANKRVTRKMWDVFVRGLKLADGRPLYCDSCHQGKATFLARDDEDALGAWMKRAFVDGLQRADGQKHGCGSCHGQPFVGGFLDDWSAAPPEQDLGVTVPDAGVDASVPTDANVPRCAPLLNELQVAGAGGAADEFIEVYNPCAAAVDLAGYTLVYRSAAGTSDLSIASLGGKTLAAGAYLVAANAGFAGTSDLRYTRALAATGGGVALRDGAGAIVDEVAYGPSTNAFVEGSPAPAPPTGKSIGRSPSGARGTHDQSHDWKLLGPTPGAAN